MTEKELLYLEDLLGAEELAQKSCLNNSNNTQDSDLKIHFTNLANYHKQNITTLYQLLR
ncbi:hypothetical protein NNC19_01855 [Clostridium sp. SHJSY1]|uniref:hypothetical protein n=1 Tax=Clostridium sp. SHJSY1 TaxID=2942483 RepID=UPI00287544FE|nr:hypothetical protein [Clostridium sp. SHJSY1]MDS0524403.1 hypothetical protein [Clostridium sp. SHJSY1]